ncbi:MAG: metal ABC transporter ATP-binding protein [Leptolyngbya sp.]|nr:metal ABC transporter ATP-binding protein [Leptolyngbya sp.]
MAPRSSRRPDNAAQGTPTITVDHLTVNYRDTQALRNINLTVRSGRLVGIFGPNGAGKSTLMKAMLGLIPVVTGRVTYGDDPLAHQLDRVAYVPQRSQIDWTFPATVWDVVMMGRVKKTGWLHRFSVTSRQVAQASLERVGMLEFKDRPIGALSGGQQQRVFLARALAQEAEIFCFDEPFVGVDQKTEGVIFQIFHDLANAGKTVLVVNHDLGESITNFDQIILLNKELIAVGPREWVLTRDHMTRAYGGHIGFFGHVA